MRAGYVLPVYLLGEFVLGAVLATAPSRGWRPPWTPWVALTLVAGAWCTLLLAGAGDGPVGPDPQEVIGDVVMVPAFAALIAATAARDADGRPWLARPRLPSLLDCVVLATLCSAVAYGWVAKPLEAWIRGRPDGEIRNNQRVAGAHKRNSST